MKKLLVFLPKTTKNGYKQQLASAAQLLFKKNEVQKININRLTEDFLKRQDFDVIVSNGLSNEWYRKFRNLKIVAVTLDDIKKYKELADIVIDCLSEESKNLFIGPGYDLNKPEFKEEFLEIINLIKILNWDTKFWGFSLSYLSCRYLTDSIIYRVNKFINKYGIKLVEYLCNCHDNRSVQIAAKENYIFTDIRITFEKKLDNSRIVDLSYPYKFSLSSRHNDISQLRNISENLFISSRYYFDEHFDKNKCNEFYQNWVEKAILGTFDDQCFCLYNNEMPMGFCTIKYLSKQKAAIGLLGISKDYQGQGLGQKLLQLVENSLIDRNIKILEAVTQGRNYDAQRLYQKAGFLTKSTELWYHKWL